MGNKTLQKFTVLQVSDGLSQIWLILLDCRYFEKSMYKPVEKQNQGCN